MATNIRPNKTMPAGVQSAENSLNIKRNVELYRYGRNSLLGKKGWNDGTIIIYDDSTLKIFKELDGYKKFVKPIHLADVILDIAFGKAALKYDPPQILGKENNFVTPENFIAIPETKERKKVHWFAAKDSHNLRDVMEAMAESVSGKISAPELGDGIQARHYHGEHVEVEKWIVYWEMQQRVVGSRHEGNGEHETGVGHVREVPIEAPPLPSVVPKESTLVPTPRNVESLRLDSDNLKDEVPSGVVHCVKLVDGRRVKEKRLCDPMAQSASAQSSIPYSISIDHPTGTSVDRSGEPVETTTTNITLTASPDEHYSQHEEREEIVTEHEKTVINVGTTERTVSTVDEGDEGVLVTTTKQSSYHRSTVTTSND